MKKRQMQGEQKTSDSFKIIPDKWYICTREACLWLEDGINYTSFMEGVSYLGADILKCNLSFEHEYYQKYFRPWTICDAKPGDILASNNGLDILIFKEIDNSISFSSYYNIRGRGEWFWVSNNFIPATKEQRDLLFKKIKEAGYKWDSDKKELKKIEGVKTRRMTNQELSWWLREHPEEHREMTYSDEDNYVSSDISYLKSEANIQVYEKIVIRKNGGEWQEPLIEEE